jgi:type I restriction enzyme S subunit
MNWETRPLAQCATFMSGGTPNKGNLDFWDGDIPWVSSGEMKEQFISDTSLHLTNAGLQAGSKLVPVGTLFVVVRGMSLATEFRVCYAMKPMAFNQDVKAIVAAEDIEPYFLFCSLRAHSKEIRELTTEAAHGTKKMEMERLLSFRILIPDRATQISTVIFVRRYDDLIENNRRRIALLEESARLLYREWFVHFRFPGSANVSIENGKPVTWRQATFADVVDSTGGATPSTSRPDYWDGEVVWLTPTDVTRNDCLYLPTSSRKISQAGYDACSATLMPAGTIFMTSRASIGYFALMDQPACTNQGFIAVVPKLAHSRNFFLFHLMSRVEEFEGKATGATFKELSKKAFRDLNLLVPDAEVLKAFEDAVQPVIDQVINLKKQNIRLMEARDDLLPKLMSGEIVV